MDFRVRTRNYEHGTSTQRGTEFIAHMQPSALYGAVEGGYALGYTGSPAALCHD